MVVRVGEGEDLGGGGIERESERERERERERGEEWRCRKVSSGGVCVEKEKKGERKARVGRKKKAEPLLRCRVCDVCDVCECNLCASLCLWQTEWSEGLPRLCLSTHSTHRSDPFG